MNILVCISICILVVFSILKLSGPEGDIVSSELYNATMNKTILQGLAFWSYWYLQESDYGKISSPKYMILFFKVGGVLILAQIAYLGVVLSWSNLFNNSTKPLTKSEYLRYAYIEELITKSCGGPGSYGAGVTCSGRGLCIRYRCECLAGYKGQYCEHFESLKEHSPNVPAKSNYEKVSEAVSNLLEWIDETFWKIIRWNLKWLICNSMYVTTTLLVAKYVLDFDLWDDSFLTAALL